MHWELLGLGHNMQEAQIQSSGCALEALKLSPHAWRAHCYLWSGLWHLVSIKVQQHRRWLYALC